MTRRWAVAGCAILSAAWGFIDGFYVEAWPAAFLVAVAAGSACLIHDRLGGRIVARHGAVEGLAGAGLILALQLCLMPALPAVLAHMHRIPGAAEAAAPLLRALGLRAGALADGCLALDAASGSRSLALSWELAALPTLMRLFAALAVAVPGRDRARRLALLPAYGAARALILVLILAGGAPMSLAFEPAITMLSFMPFVLVAGGPDRCSAPRDVLPRERRWRRAAAAAALLSAGAGLLGWRHGYREAGHLLPGRVLIDESRSDWEWTEPPFDHALYGQKSLYNYGLWRSWIDLHYPTRVIRHPPMDVDLDDADVLIIKTPTQPYEPETIERIERFVRSGGGLYLVGDHTNLFGMSTALNGIAAPYGVAFEHDDTFPLNHEAYDVFRPDAIAAHPILRGIPAYAFETSCTLRVPWSADHLMVGRRLAAEPVDYGQVNFFGNMRLDAAESFGLFAQAAAVSHGEGRVVAFADSTNFSNFSMLWPGRRELTLNVIDWLNRRTRPRDRLPRRLALGAGLAAAAAGAQLVIRCGAAPRALAIWFALGAFVAAGRGASMDTARRFGAPPARREYSRLAFDTSLSSFGLQEVSPIVTRADEPPWQGFNAFFINAARSGVWPEVAVDLQSALRDCPAVALLNPQRRPSAEQMRAMGAFLGRGGRLLVLDSVLNETSASGFLTGPFGLRLEPAALDLAESGGRARVPALAGAAADDARRMLLRGGTTALWRDVRGGRIVLVHDAALFSDRAFGGVYAAPTDEQREVYAGEGDLLRILLATTAERSSP